MIGFLSLFICSVGTTHNCAIIYPYTVPLNKGYFIRADAREHAYLYKGDIFSDTCGRISTVDRVGVYGALIIAQTGGGRCLILDTKREFCSQHETKMTFGYAPGLKEFQKNNPIEFVSENFIETCRNLSIPADIKLRTPEEMAVGLSPYELYPLRY